jgi:PKD repeat protein
MRSKIIYVAIILVLSLFGKIALSQENFASNISKSISEDGKLLVTYDVASTDGAKSFSVILLLTYEGKQIEAKSAYGDIGSGISPGKEKAIVWYYKDDFEGDIQNVAVDVFAYKENEPRAVFQVGSISNNGYAPCKVDFLNNSSYANEYQWDFGDPSSGVENVSFTENPSHVYKTGGIYSIALTARNTQLNLENKYYQSIEVKTHDPVVADFKIEGNNQMPTAKVDFINTSVNADTYHWNFGDSFCNPRQNESDKENPRHKYKEAGTFTVTLTVKNNFSKLSDTMTKEVIVGQQKVAEAKFIYTKSSEIAPSTVVFKNTSVNASKYEWDFGDPDSGAKNSSDEANPAHVFTQQGSYEVELSAWASGERKPSKYSEVITVSELPKPPEAEFSINNNNVLGPVTIIFDNKSVNAEKYLWDFGDPDSGDENTSEEMNPTHTYKNPGRYKVVLTASRSGFKKESTATDYVVIKGGTRSEDVTEEESKSELMPVAEFDIEADDNSAPATVSFKNNSSDADILEWDFGDPDSGSNTSNDANPAHKYEKPGEYNVQLKVTNKSSGLTNTFSRIITISPPAIVPVAGFVIRNNNSIAPARVSFINDSENATGYSWNFGDPDSGSSNTSTRKNPEHIYEKAGEYKVVLEVVNEESGRKNVAEKTILVEKPLKPPVANFEIELSNNYVPANAGFKNLSVNADTYKWNFGDFDSDKNKSSEKMPSHNYTVPGNYVVTLEAINSETGESHEVSKEITLISSFSTFVKHGDLKGSPENACSVVPSANDEFMVITGMGDKVSQIMKIDNNGEIIDHKKLDYQAYNIVPLARDEFMIVGVNEDGKMLVQLLESDLDTGNPVLFMQNKNYATEFAPPKIALSKTNEIGIVANILNDRYPVDIMFQKTDNSGKIIPLTDRTFKYVGKKMATDIIQTGDGGFAMTGYWQENDNSPMMILFGKIDRRGHGEMQLISSEMNIIGCDIEGSYQGGYAVLRAKENVENKDLYEISFILISSSGGPTDCANMLPCSIKKEDIFKYKPSMIKMEDGYVVATHSFNGVDYDIILFWIDKTGEELIKYENLSMDGDQYVMDLIRASDGGYLISGTQKINNKHEALIIKTDPFGKLN